MKSKVTPSLNVELQRTFVRAKVEEALRQMVSLESLGLDGFEAGFYQGCYEKIGDQVRDVVLKFLNGKIRLKPYINFTNIVLIPKIPNPLVVSDSICLCNVVYKLI